MAKIKISSKVEQRAWEALQALAAHSFLMERFQSGTCDFERLLPWIRGALVRNRDLDPGSSPG